MTKRPRQSRFAVILAFGLVYFFWGSTYLAIDIAVERIPPSAYVRLAFSDCRRLHVGVLRSGRGRTIWYNPHKLGQMAR